MRDFYRLYNYEFRYMAPAGILCLAGLLTPLVLLGNELRGFSQYATPRRFEELLAASGAPLVAGILAGLMCLLFLRSFYSGYTGSKSIYTLLTLPVGRQAMYFSKLLAFAAWLLALAACILLGVTLAYGFTEARMGSMDQRYVMENGLFLAFLRSGLLRLLLPLSIHGAISSLALLLLLTTGVYYGVLCERSGAYWGLAAIAAALWLMAHVAWGRMGEPGFYPALDVRETLAMAGFSIFFIWHSVSLINRGAIA